MEYGEFEDMISDFIGDNVYPVGDEIEQRKDYHKEMEKLYNDLKKRFNPVSVIAAALIEKEEKGQLSPYTIKDLKEVIPHE